MSLYLPRTAVAKENMNQLVRRTRLEMKHSDAIKGFQELLKEKQTVLPAILALGFTKKHAVNLEMRLIWANDAEAQAEKHRLAREAKLRQLEEEKAQAIEKAASAGDNSTNPPVSSEIPKSE